MVFLMEEQEILSNVQSALDQLYLLRDKGSLSYNMHEKVVNNIMCLQQQRTFLADLQSQPSSVSNLARRKELLKTLEECLTDARRILPTLKQQIPLPPQPKNEQKKVDNSNDKQSALGNAATTPKSEENTTHRILKRHNANILLYCTVTGFLAIVAGIVLYAYGKLPPQIAQIAGGLGALIVIISGLFGSTVEKSFPQGFLLIWKKSNRVMIISASILTVLVLSLVVLVIPLI